MAKIDQEMRNQARKNKNAWNENIDHAHTARLKQIATEAGWPTISNVGQPASDAAWLLVQHASAEPDFMKQCLRRIKALPANEVDPAGIAYLEDRILLLDGKPQTYGTQFCNKGNGWEPFPIEDVGNVDERRAEAGLGTLAKNEERIRAMYE